MHAHACRGGIEAMRTFGGRYARGSFVCEFEIKVEIA